LTYESKDAKRSGAQFDECAPSIGTLGIAATAMHDHMLKVLRQHERRRLSLHSVSVLLNFSENFTTTTTKHAVTFA
jgi:hypothetical protein